MITEFTGENRFLSNFYEHQVWWKHPDMAAAMWWPTNEHAFQAAKTSLLSQVHRIWSAATPGGAKQLGRTVNLKPYWDGYRKRVMLDLLLAKFDGPVAAGEELLSLRLLNTGDEVLVEGNTWGDDYWGMVRKSGTWSGHNYLGQLLMAVRLVVRDD